MSVFTPSGSGGIPASPVAIEAATERFTANVAMAVAGTEYSYTFPIGCKMYTMKLRDKLAKFQLASVALASGTIYETINHSVFVWETDLNLTATRTLYFQSSSNLQVMEISYWI